MDRTPDLRGRAPNSIIWTTHHGVDHLTGRLRPPYTDNRDLTPPLQLWDLLMHMFDTARQRYMGSTSYTLRMGVGVTNANRYNLSMRGRLNQNPDPNVFFDRIERMLDSNDSFDIRDIRLLMVLID